MTRTSLQTMVGAVRRAADATPRRYDLKEREKEIEERYLRDAADFIAKSVENLSNQGGRS